MTLVRVLHRAYRTSLSTSAHGRQAIDRLRTLPLAAGHHTLCAKAAIVPNALSAVPLRPFSTPLSSSSRSMVRMAPTVAPAAARDYGSFKLLQSVQLEYAPVTVTKWRSEKTGLTVTLGRHDTPITNGYFVVASEIFDDTGRPHTLEHLVFLGSKDYPYKGVLDSLANRAGSDGTNAWTANDHTAYTIATAGSKGFLEMLPIYVDHILHPTLTDAGFVTEVHHINGSAEDAGVVYSEMQGRENQAGDRMSLELQRMMYPQTSAYRSETGGLLKMLRILTVEQIREYHAKYYVPYNVRTYVAELFDVLNSKVEPMILAAQTASGKSPIPSDWKRPFVETSTAQPLSIAKSETKVVEFMEEDESMGDVSLVFLGPQPTDYTTNTALQILGSYLTQSAVSPLRKAFIEIGKPYATSIGFYSEDRVNSVELAVHIQDVPKKHLMDMAGLLRAKLGAIASQDGIDMERMGLILRRDKRKMLNSMETSVSGVLVDVVVGDFLYGEKNGKDLPRAFDDLKDYELLEKWTPEQWIALLDKYYVSANCLTAIGKPSAALSAQIDNDEKERLASQKAELGEDGLKKLAEKLEEAKKASDVPIPPAMLTEFPLTDPAAITWVPVETAINNAHRDTSQSENGEVQKHIDADQTALPFQAHFSHVKSNFVLVNVLFDTIDMPEHLRPYLYILQSALFSLGVKRADGTVLSYEEVVNALNDFTVAQSISFNFRNCFSETLVLSLKVEKDKYEQAVQWIRDLVTGAVFSVDRLKVTVAKELQALPYQKRDGNGIARAVVNRLTYDMQRSSSEATALLNLLEFIPKIADDLESDPESVVKLMEEMRAELINPAKIRVNVSGDILALPSPKTTLARSFIPIKEAAPLDPLSLSLQTLSPLGANPSKKLVLVPMASIEGSYSVHYARGFTGWDHPDVPAIQLAMNVLNTMESYLWKSIRGAGLAYGAHVEYDAESGLVGFGVYRSPNAMLAYREAGKVLKQLADGEIELDQNIVDGARAGLTYSYARKSETVMAAAGTAYLDECLRGVGKDFSRDMLVKLQKVTLAELRDVIKRYFLPIFSPDTAIGGVAVNTGKADEVEAGFRDMGYEVERSELPTLGDDDSQSGSGSEHGDEDMESGSEGESGSEDEPMQEGARKRARQ